MGVLDNILGSDPSAAPDPNDPSRRDAVIAGRPWRVPTAIATPPFNPDAATLPGSQRPATVAPPITGSSPISSNPPHPEVPQSSTLDQIMQTDRAALDEARKRFGELPNAPPKANLWSDPEHGKLRTLLTMFAGGVEGGITGSIKEGMRVMEPSLAQPQEQANKTWTAQQTSSQRAFEDALQKFNADILQSREAREAGQASEASAARNRTLDLEGKRLEATQKGETDRTQIEQQRLDLERGRENQPKTDAELALAMHKTGPDGKPTPEAIQAGQAFKDLQKQRLDQIHATKNPNERVALYKDLQTNYVQMRGQLEREATAIEGNIMSKNDPASQAQLKALRESISGIDKDLEFVNGEVRKAAGIPGAGGIQQFQGTQQFTVSAQGKPSVQKALTYQQVQQLQQAGVQLSPVQAAPKK